MDTTIFGVLRYFKLNIYSFVFRNKCEIYINVTAQSQILFLKFIFLFFFFAEYVFSENTILVVKQDKVLMSKYGCKEYDGANFYLILNNIFDMIKVIMQRKLIAVAYTLRTY